MLTYKQFKQATKIQVSDDPEDVITIDQLVAQMEQDHKERELGVSGAFKRSIPISLLIAGISGLAIGLKSGSPAAGIATGLVTGGLTAGMNTYLNRHATPEEAGTSFYAAV